jgi:hypothetical protein
MSELNTIDAFDSLTGAHERIDKILHDRGFTNRLTLFKWSSSDITQVETPRRIRENPTLSDNIEVLVQFNRISHYI